MNQGEVAEWTITERNSVGRVDKDLSNGGGESWGIKCL
jgi:hypothetical protein